VRVVGATTVVSRTSLAPYLSAAAREWERPDTARTHADLLERVRHYRTRPRQFADAGTQRDDASTAHVDRAEALAALYRDLPVTRAGVLITSAVELMGRVVRDHALLAAVRDRSRPASSDGEARTQTDHPAVWRASMVALGLMGTPPTAADLDAAQVTHDGLSATAVVQAATLADPCHGARAAVAFAESRAAGVSAQAAMSTRRLALGRLITVVG